MVNYTEEASEKYDSERDILGRAGGAYGHFLADGILFNKEVEALEKENELEKKAKFIQMVDGMNINPDSIFKDRIEKEKLVREYRERNRVKKNIQNQNRIEQVDFYSRCSDARIGVIFRDLYRSFSRALKSR
jgi:hypothetical protein